MTVTSVKCSDIWKGRCCASYCSHLTSEINQGCANPVCQFAWAIEFIWDGIEYLWVLNMEFASCQLSGACNFEVPARFWGKYANPCVIAIRMAFWIYVHALKLEDFWRVNCIYTKVQHYRSAVIIAANWKCSEKYRQKWSLQYRPSFKCCASVPFVTNIISFDPTGDGTRNQSNTDPAVPPATWTPPLSRQWKH